MRMKAKTYGINFLVSNILQLNIFSDKVLAIQKFIPYIYLDFNFCKLYIRWVSDYLI